jgi:hypothetical protein
MRPDASIECLGQLHCVGPVLRFSPEGCRPNLTAAVDGVPGIFPGIPWYLDDLRPEGFMGRAALRSGANTQLPEDPDLWQPHHAVRGLLNGLDTGIGDLLLGENAVHAALRAIETPPDLVTAPNRPHAYVQLASASLRGELTQPGPGGQQPKFTATIEHEGGRYAVLVKFANVAVGPAAERWSDLLVCEHLALSLLHDAGMGASKTTLIQTDSHTFLEVQRFDRLPDTLGRKGFVSLMAITSAFVGDATLDWSRAAEELAAQGWIQPQAAREIGRLHAFGRLIGNTDMHQGNIGFRLVDSGPLPLAPLYDMLPMSLAPSRTGVLRATSPIAPVAPTRAGQLAVLRWAAPWAVEYWGRVAASPLLRSAVLRQVAAENAERVGAMAQRYG